MEAEFIRTVQRTNEYVQQQCELLFPDTQHNAVQPPGRNDDEIDIQDSTQITNPVTTNTQTNPPPANRKVKQEQTVSNMYLPSPTKHTGNLINDRTKPNNTQEFAKYLIRREFVSTGLLQFDDKPENYWAWKTSFVKECNKRPEFAPQRRIGPVNEMVRSKVMQTGQTHLCCTHPKSCCWRQDGLAMP